MIVEREQMMSERQLANPEWFPNYIIVRRPEGDEEGSGN